MSTSAGDDARVILQQRQHRVGSRVRVHNVPGGYPLPDGLPEGAQVVVVAIEPGSRIMEFEGRRFTVPQACVNSGFRMIPEFKRPHNAS